MIVPKSSRDRERDTEIYRERETHRERQREKKVTESHPINTNQTFNIIFDHIN